MSQGETQIESDELLTGHLYDGIQEYDNPLPGWWTMLFLLTIIYSVLYLIYFHSGKVDRSMIDSYDLAVADNLRVQFAEIGQLNPDRETILTYIDDPKWSMVGKAVYQMHCTSCHGANGEGKIGPNLTDNLWKNVKVVEDIAKVVSEGAAGNAMPSWKTRLHPNEIVLVASYVASLRGTLPAGTGKIIPGEVPIPHWGEPPATEQAPADAVGSQESK
ncbi:MAG: c-type cytochrome [Planctomycetaceae bacterium]|nr:c-type cytochrome [Planctomycetaceae bacterium]